MMALLCWQICQDLGMQFTPPEAFLPTMARYGPIDLCSQPVPDVGLDHVAMPLQAMILGMTHMQGGMAHARS